MIHGSNRLQHVPLDMPLENTVALSYCLLAKIMLALKRVTNCRELKDHIPVIY